MLRDFISFFETKPTLIWSLVVLYAGVIFYLSSIPIPPQPIPPENPLLELLTGIEHIAEYTILGGLLFTGFRSLGGNLNNRALLLAFLFAAVYGAMDEIHQYFVPNRYCDIKDLMADSAGGLIGAIGVKRLRD